MTTPRRLPLVLAGSALLAGVQLPAQAPQQPAQTAMELLEKAIEAKSSGDHAGALVFYNRAADLLAEDPSGQDGMGLLVRADLQRDIARASHAAGISDPCAALAKGKAYLDQARRMPSAEGGVNVGPIADEMRQQLEHEGRRMRCVQPGPPTDMGTPDAALAGHYYLSGVMETGSELLLKADGRFDWYISYGAVDQVARGRWGRTDQTVTLTADLPSTDAPLFRTDGSRPWDLEIERALRDHARMREETAIAERCPWGAAAATTPSLALAEDRAPASAAERQQAMQARAAAEAARDAANRAIAKAVAPAAGEADRDAAQEAMTAWHNAQYDMDQAYRVASLPVPEIAPPTAPECELPPAATHGPIAAAEWQRGVGVLVGDPARETGLSRIAVTFVFSDGHRAETRTSRGGWGFAPLRKGAAVEQLVLTLPPPHDRSATLSIPPLAEGVQTVAVDTQQLVVPPFAIMRLEVRGRDLIPETMGRGRYSRN